MKDGPWKALAASVLVVSLLALAFLWFTGPFRPDENARKRGERTLFLGQVDEIEHGRSTELWFYETQGVDAYLDQAATLRALKSLDLNRTDITDAGIQSVSRMAGLQELNVCGGRITAQGIEQLALCTNLESLDLAGIPTTVKGIDKLARLPKLRTLIVDGKRIK